MATDNIAGHTAAQNTLGQDGLRDGDSLSPTTLTNLIQGVQGNGILRYQDGAYGSTRNETNSGNQPGSMVRASASTLTVSGGFAVLDGALYEFGSGVGNTITLDLNSGSHGSGALALSANEEVIFTIYVAPSGGNNKVYYEAGSPVDTTTGVYPSAANQYLIDYDTGATQDNMKTVVLAHVRVQYVASGGGTNNLNILEINDKRVFIEGSADYRVPLSVGTITSGEIVDGGAEGINTIAHLNAIHNDNGELAVTDTVNAHWVSHPRYGSFAQTPPSSSDAGYGQGPSRGVDRGGTHAADSFYFAGRNNEQTGHYSVRLQGMGVDATATALTTNGTWVLTAEGDSFLMLSPNGGVTITLNPERDASANYKFPEGHIIEVCNDGTGSIVFDNQTSPNGLNATLSAGHRATFIYDGSEWLRCDYQSAIIANVPAIYDNSGTPAFTTGITQGEVLTLLGITTGISNGNYLIANANVADNDFLKIDGTSVEGRTASEVLSDLGVEAGATADQSNAEIRAAVEAATDSNVFTDADHTKLNGIATGATAYTDADAIAAVEGESTLTLSSGVTVGTDLKISSTSNHVTIQNETQDKDIIFKVNDGGVETEVMRISGNDGRIGIGGVVGPNAQLHLQSSTSSQPELRLENTNIDTQEACIRFMKNTASPAIGDDLGLIRFEGDDSVGSNTLFALIMSQMVDPTNNQEAGEIFLNVKHKGETNTVQGLAVSGHGTGNAAVVINDGGRNDFNFRVESDNEQFMLFVDAADDRVGIGLGAPKTKLTVEGAITLKEQANADADTAAYGQLWVKTATPNELYFTTDAGNDIQLTSGTSIAGGGGGGGASLAFKTIAVTGQTDVVADAADDTLTLAGGGATTITTNAGTDTVTITSTDTAAAAADAYNAGLSVPLPISGGGGPPPGSGHYWDAIRGPPTTTEEAVERIAAWIYDFVQVHGPGLTPALNTLA